MNRSIKIFLVIALFSLLLRVNPVHAADPISGSSLDPTRISFQETASGLVKPVFITNAGDGSGRIFIVERGGRIRIQKNGSILAAPFLDIHTIVKSASGEQGLLALAFDPSYAANGNFYVAYTAPRNGDATGSNLVLEKFSVSASDPDLADPGSGTILLSISHSTHSNHNGGTLAFGGDGYLYWSTGDGGGSGDPGNNAQDLTSRLGKILRLDVHSGSPYSVPPTNPFYNNPDPSIRQEIWAYGLRNPWRFSFDRITGDMYIGDVGQRRREEIDFQAAASSGGENYGWRIMEGSLCYNPSSGCNSTGKILPVVEYSHSVGCAVTGGYAYRGANYPPLQGYYFYADYCTGKMFSLHNDVSSGWIATQIADLSFNISTFGEDEQGNLYLADYSNGKIYQIQYQGPKVVSITRADPNPTNASSVNFTVTTSENVTGVDASDFILTTTGMPDAVISGVNGTDPGNTYTVTVSTGAGEGTIRLDVTDDDTIMDAYSIPLGGIGLANGNFTGGETYTIDRTAPTVLSITRANSNPTVATSVNFLATFSESVTGVETSDFALTAAGVTDPSISGVSGSGATRTITVNTGSGDGTIRLDVSDTANVNDLAGNPLAGPPFIDGETYTKYEPQYLTFTSSGDRDGRVLESTETSGVGGSINSTASTLRLGDDKTKKQYRAILSFATGDLPDNAVITKVTLKVRKQGIVGGGNPVTDFQGFMVDLKKGYFGTTASLQVSDFQATASKSSYGPFKPALSGGWYSINLTSGKTYINKLSTASGLTQIRLRFKLDDNNNTVANYLSLYSGNASSSYRPQLIIEYYVP